MATIAERMEKLQKKQEELQQQEQQVKAQYKALASKQAEKEKKARTHRLVQIGGAVEGVLGRPIPKEDLPKLISFLKQQEERGQYFSRAMNASAPSEK